MQNLPPDPADGVAAAHLSPSSHGPRALGRREALRSLLGLAGVCTTFPMIGSLAAADLQGTEEEGHAAPKPPPGVFDRGKYFETQPIVVEKLTDRVHLLAGPGGGILFVPTDAGTTLVDAGWPSRTLGIVSAIGKVTSQRIATVINTHWHIDHTGGNEALARSGARIIAHENVRKRLGSEQRMPFFGQVFPPKPAVAWPTLTYSDGVVWYAGEEELRLTHVPSARTDGDTFVFLPHANVLHTGDLFFNGMYPFIDVTADGSLGGLIAAVDKMLRMADAKTRIVSGHVMPGHSPTGTREELQAYRNMLQEVFQRVEPLVRAGKSADEAVAAAPTRNLDDDWGKGFFKPDQFVRFTFESIRQCLAEEHPS